jgi:hypothetical protein
MGLALVSAEQELRAALDEAEAAHLDEGREVWGRLMRHR